MFGDDNELARGAGGGLGGVDVHAQSVTKRHRQVAGRRGDGGEIDDEWGGAARLTVTRRGGGTS